MQDFFEPLKEPAGVGTRVVRIEDTTVVRYLRPFEEVFLTIGEYRKGGRTRFNLVGRGMLSMLFSLFGATVLRDSHGREWRVPANDLGILFRVRDEPYEVRTCDRRDMLTLGLHMTHGALSKEPFRSGLEGLPGDVLASMGGERCVIATIGMTAAVRSLVLSTVSRLSDPHPCGPLEVSILTLELLNGIAGLVENRCGQGLAAGNGLAAGKGASLKLPRREAERMFAAKQILDSRFGQRLLLADLARELSMSERKLKSVFRAVFGLPPMEYLQGVRIARAQQMLREDSSSIGEIAWAVGYGHQGNFTAAFKRETGLSPREFRRRC